MELVAFLTFMWIFAGNGALAYDQDATGVQCQAIVRDAEGHGQRECNLGPLVLRGPVGTTELVAQSETQVATLSALVP